MDEAIPEQGNGKGPQEEVSKSFALILIYLFLFIAVNVLSFIHDIRFNAPVWSAMLDLVIPGLLAFSVILYLCDSKPENFKLFWKSVPFQFFALVAIDLYFNPAQVPGGPDRIGSAAFVFGFVFSPAIYMSYLFGFSREEAFSLEQAKHAMKTLNNWLVLSIMISGVYFFFMIDPPRPRLPYSDQMSLRAEGDVRNLKLAVEAFYADFDRYPLSFPPTRQVALRARGRGETVTFTNAIGGNGIYGALKTSEDGQCYSAAAAYIDGEDVYLSHSENPTVHLSPKKKKKGEVLTWDHVVEISKIKANPDLVPSLYPLVRAIREYHKKNGRYPKSFAPRIGTFEIGKKGIKLKGGVCVGLKTSPDGKFYSLAGKWVHGENVYLSKGSEPLFYLALDTKPKGSVLTMKDVPEPGP